MQRQQSNHNMTTQIAAINEDKWRRVVDVLSMRDEGALAALSRASKAHRSMSALHLDHSARTILAESSVVHDEPNGDLGSREKDQLIRFVGKSRRFLRDTGLTGDVSVPDFIALSLVMARFSTDFVPDEVAMAHGIRHDLTHMARALPAQWTDWGAVPTRDIIEFVKHYYRRWFRVRRVDAGTYQDPSAYDIEFLLGVKALSIWLARTLQATNANRRPSEDDLGALLEALSPAKLRGAARTLQDLIEQGHVLIHEDEDETEEDAYHAFLSYHNGQPDESMPDAVDGVVRLITMSMTAFFGTRGAVAAGTKDKTRMSLAGAIGRTRNARDLRAALKVMRRMHRRSPDDETGTAAHEAYVKLNDALRRHREAQQRTRQ